MSKSRDYRPKAGRFLTTRWSLVLEAKRDDQEGERALAELCGLYWPPVYAYVRRRGHQVEEAKDLTQAFFCHLLQRGDLARAEQERGRFRSYVLTCAQHFLSNAQVYDRAEKRGGGASPVSLDGADPEARIDPVDTDTLSPEAAYERAWAVALIDGVTARLGLEFDERNRGALFGSLKVYLEGDGSGPSYAEKAAELEMTTGLVKVSVHRMRRRFRELLQAEVEHTLADVADTDDEIGCLLASLALK